MQMTNATYTTWIVPSALVSLETVIDGDRAVISVPTDYVRDWLANRMDALIRRTLGGVVGHEIVDISYILEGDEMSRGPPYTMELCQAEIVM